MSLAGLDLGDLSRRVLDAIQSGVMVLDLGSHVLTLNAEGERLLDVEREELIGRAILEDHRFFPLVLLVNEHRKEGPSLAVSRRQLPTEVHRRDGRSVPLSVTVSNLLDDDGVVQGYVMAIRDLTQVRSLESRARRSEQLASLGAMAAAMAHEVRNPLHAILSAAELIEAMHGAGRPIEKYLHAVFDEVAALERLVQDVLSFSRVYELRVDPLDLGALAKETGELLRLPDGVHLAVEVEEGLPPIEGDKERLQQVLRNLVRNAEGGMIRIVARRGARRRLPGGEDLEPVPFVVLEVRDEGPGIAPEDVSHLFEPFFTKRTSGEGTGLGLAICRRIVEAHDGVVEVEARPGEGACFQVHLPVLPVLASVAPPRPGAGGAGWPWTCGRGSRCSRWWSWSWGACCRPPCWTGERGSPAPRCRWSTTESSSATGGCSAGPCSRSSSRACARPDRCSRRPASPTCSPSTASPGATVC